MNKVILMGRLTRDAQTRYTEGTEPMAISRFTLAVDRQPKAERNISADVMKLAAVTRGLKIDPEWTKKKRSNCIGIQRTS